MNLYLDQSDGLLGDAADGYLLNASRLGLIFGGDTSNPIILRLSESENPENAQVYNTEVNGKLLGKNQVLGYNENGVFATTDPSVLVSDYTISFTNNQMTLPKSALLSMEFGKIYAVDIYFYLEGCDPDCSESVQLMKQSSSCNSMVYLTRRRAIDDRTKKKKTRQSETGYTHPFCLCSWLLQQLQQRQLPGFPLQIRQRLSR